MTLSLQSNKLEKFLFLLETRTSLISVKIHILCRKNISKVEKERGHIAYFSPVQKKINMTYNLPQKFLCTILVKIYWHFWSFFRFSKFEVLAKKSILGYLLNGIGYFKLGGVYRLPGYILSLVGTFFTFWILKSWSLKSNVKTLLVQASLEHFQIICGFENSWEFPFCAKYYDRDCG